MEDDKKTKESHNKTMKGIFRKDDLDDSSASEWGLTIDDDYKPRPRKRVNQSIKFEEEELNLICDWDCCNEIFDDYDKFIDHLTTHINQYNCSESEGSCMCYWKDCLHKAPSLAHLNQHLIYHGYHTKLKNIGKNVEKRFSLPKCIQRDEFVIPTNLNGYICEWEYCDATFTTIHEYLKHMLIHLNNNPKSRKEGIVSCCWKACNFSNFPTRYKLREHMRVHTKEKIIACPTCGNLFATRTKFCDHRKRQIPTESLTYLCSQCSKLFPSERLLKDHMRRHINNHKCSMCDMTCPTPWTLAKHVRYRHLNEKPYKCDICDFRGVSKHNLDVHLKIHAEDGSQKCDDCEFRCRTPYGLEKHQHAVHDKEWTNIYECHNCKATFKRGGYLTKHLMRVHKYHWPSGHSRFRYKKDQDGVLRLQTVRYETLDVTEHFIKSKTLRTKSNNKPGKYNLRSKGGRARDDRVPQFEVVEVEEVDEEDEAIERNSIIITIDDLDAKGNVLKSQIVQSGDVIPENYIKTDDDEEVDGDASS